MPVYWIEVQFWGWRDKIWRVSETILSDLPTSLLRKLDTSEKNNCLRRLGMTVSTIEQSLHLNVALRSILFR